ncbi:MAG: alkaline phosphatase family protein [Lachnospirales bacterium]
MNSIKPNVLLVSVDALTPSYVFSDLELPNIKKYFVQKGAYAEDGIRSVFPTFTYPCHQSIITGAYPINHGIHNNIIFDPLNNTNNAWNWFTSKKVKNLWEETKKNGYTSASTAFPTSLGADGSYIIPEFWWNNSELDEVFINNLSNPQGIVDEIKKDIGKYPNGLDLTLDGDIQRFKSAMWLLDKKLLNKDEPFFLSTYFASFDETMHVKGVYSKEAKECLMEIDKMIGKLVEKVSAELTDGKGFIVALVSDHGSLDNHSNICPNTIFFKKGWLKLDEKEKIKDWQVFSNRAGGCSEIRIKDSGNEIYKEVKDILEDLVLDVNSGVLEVLDSEQCKKRNSFPNADFVIVSKKGYEIRDDYLGSYMRKDIAQKAQHGYSEDFEEMYASFMIHGTNIPENKKIGKMNLIDIAPTLADIMNFKMNTADGVSKLKNILEA